MPEFVGYRAAERNAGHAKSIPRLDRDAGGARVDGLSADFEQVVSSDGAPDVEAKVACGSRLPSDVVAGTAPSHNLPDSWMLRNGREVTVRPIIEADAAEIVQAFERLPAASFRQPCRPPRLEGVAACVEPRHSGGRLSGRLGE